MNHIQRTLATIAVMLAVVISGCSSDRGAGEGLVRGRIQTGPQRLAANTLEIVAAMRKAKNQALSLP